MIKFILLYRYLKLKLLGNLAHLGWKVILQQGVELRGMQSIWLDDYVNLDSHVLLQVISKEAVAPKPNIIIRKNVGIGPRSVLLAINKVEIHEDAMIGPSCVIVDYDHTYKDIKHPIRMQPLSSRGPIVIEQGAWLSSHVTVCSGVRIGKHAVIGANSVVTKDIPAYSVAVGSPAKVIKRYNQKTKKWERA